MSSLVSFFVVVCILASALSQEAVNQIVDGPCSRFQVVGQQPFTKKLLAGTWYVYASYDYSNIVGLDCLRTFYQVTPDGNIISFESGKNLLTNGRSSFQSVYLFDQTGVGHYTLGTGSDAENLLIPITDYVHYYIEFSCVDLPEGESDCYIGIFTRFPSPSAVTLNKINGFINAHQIDRSKLRYINHDKTRCFL